MIDSGKFRNWKEVTPILNQELYEDESDYKDECTYRQSYKHAKNFYENVFAKRENDNYLNEIQIQKQEIKKEKQKLSDERISLNRSLREQARKEELLDMFKKAIDERVTNKYSYSPIQVTRSDNDLIVHLTDLHIGLEIYNSFNSYNTSHLNLRLRDYLDEINEIRSTHLSENCYLILGGDIINGLIHVNSRIENKENVIEQIITASEALSWFTYELSKMFSKVEVHLTAGNHSRAMPNKEDALKGENFDLLIPHYMKAALNDVSNVIIKNNTLDKDICTFEVRGHKVIGVHGDKDAVSSVVYNMIKLARYIPDIIYLGHRHTNGLSTIDNVKVIESGCLDGMDNYSIDKRLVGRPEQTVTVVTKDKCIKCLYDIQFN